MVIASKAETTPLIGGQHRRRTTPQHHQQQPPSNRQSPRRQHQQQHPHGTTTASTTFSSSFSATTTSSTTNPPHYRAPVMYTDSGNDSTFDNQNDHKIDRRSQFQKLASSIASCLSQCIRRTTTTTTTGNRNYGTTSNSTSMLPTQLLLFSMTNDLDDDDHYEDTFNDDPWTCTFGTNELDGIWMNNTDKVGNIMSGIVWVLMIYSCMTISLLAHQEQLPKHIAMIYCTICALALSCHAKTMFTDPGSIPTNAIPRPILFAKGITTHSMCSHCQTYKPPNTHHCRICNRCISRMDHHCPWMNNCVGAGNFKHFILFLIYTWTGCVFALILFASNYFFCTSEKCIFPLVLMQLVRFMTVLCIVTLLFVSSMLMNVTYGIITGVGTIDRLKKKATDTVHISDEEPIQLTDVFGIEGYYTWCLPIDPVFEDYDRVIGYSIPARLKRELDMLDGVSQVTTTASDFIQPPMRHHQVPSSSQSRSGQQQQGGGGERQPRGRRQTQQLYPPPSSSQRQQQQQQQNLRQQQQQHPLHPYHPRRQLSVDPSFSSASSSWDNP